MDEIEIYATATVSILGVAYPIILQVISRLDDRYASVRIVDLFEQEPRRIWFRIQLFISLLAVFIWTLKLKPLPFFADIGFIINNSAAILVVVSTCLLVISFILLVHRIYDYIIPTRFSRYLIRRHNERNRS